PPRHLGGMLPDRLDDRPRRLGVAEWIGLARGRTFGVALGSGEQIGASVLDGLVASVAGTVLAGHDGPPSVCDSRMGSGEIRVPLKLCRKRSPKATPPSEGWRLTVRAFGANLSHLSGTWCRRRRRGFVSPFRRHHAPHRPRRTHPVFQRQRSEERRVGKVR